MIQVHLSDWPWRVVRRLAGERGVRAWPVGGAVRDALLHRPVHDWDFGVDRDALGLARAVADALDGAYFPLDTERDAGRVVLMAADGARLELLKKKGMLVEEHPDLDSFRARVAKLKDMELFAEPRVHALLLKIMAETK